MPVDASAVTIRIDRAAGTELRRVNPQGVLLGRIAPAWKVVQPLVVSVESAEDGSYIVSDEVFFMYGEGDAIRAAIQDYIAALIEYYEILSLHEDEPTVALFRYLQTYLQPISR